MPETTKAPKKATGIMVSYILAGILLVISFYILCISFIKPVREETIQYSNNVALKTTSSFKVDVIPNILYPSGGYIDYSGGEMPSKIIKDLKLNLRSEAFGEKDFKASGTCEVRFVLSGGDMWQKEYVLSKEKSFSIGNGQGTVIADEIQIPINDYYNFIEQVHKDLGLYSESYTGELVTLINGQIEGGSHSKAFEIKPFVKFDLSGGMLKLIYSDDDVSNIELKDSNIKENYFRFLNLNVPVVHTRIFSAILFSLLIVSFSIKFISVLIVRYRDRLTEYMRYENKIKDKLVELESSPDFSNNSIVFLKTFKSLIRLAEELDQLVFVYRKSSETNYYITGFGCVYKFVHISDTFDWRKDKI